MLKNMFERESSLHLYAKKEKSMMHLIL